MKLRPFLPAASIAAAGIVAVLIWNVSTSYQRKEPEGFTISGRVVGADATVMKDLQVRVRWMEDGAVRSVTVPVEADGSFSVNALPPGVYALAAVRPADGAEAAPRTLASADVTVENADVSGIVLNVAR